MDNQIIVSRITELCKEKDVSVNRMLQETGQNKNVVDNLKKGSKPSIEKVSAIAEYFNVSVDYILGKTENKMPGVTEDDELNEYLEELKNRSEMRMLFSLAKGATKQDVEKAVAIIQALRETNNE